MPVSRLSVLHTVALDSYRSLFFHGCNKMSEADSYKKYKRLFSLQFWILIVLDPMIQTLVRDS